VFARPRTNLFCSDKKDGGKKTKAEKRAEKIKKQQLAAKQGSSESSDDG
jgi:hypothetical protein